jgi:uncharacterized membrane protein
MSTISVPFSLIGFEYLRKDSVRPSCIKGAVTTSLRLGLSACFATALLVAFINVAHADFRLCNNTPSKVGVAIGYKDVEGWATEGWWNIAGNGACETLLQGELTARFYYIYAVDYDRGGEWSGQAFMCTRDKVFTIRGTEDCLARGYDRTGFFEVDTGEQHSWTVQLTDTTEQASPRPAGAPLIPSPTGGRQNPIIAPVGPGSGTR